MKQLLVIILILLTNLASQAATYLIADQTAKDAFNFSSVVAGDSVLFQRSNSFYGTITVSNSGTAGNPIFFGSYGTGDDPVITGFTDVTAWTNLGSNIWESTSAVSTLTTCNIVLVNGVNTPMGRTPNFGTYYTYQTFSGNTSITSSDLSGTPNWTGADIVIRKAGWLWQAGVVSSQSGSTVTYADKQANAYPGQQQNNCGFFFQADIRTLDTQNEWYYNPTTKKISVYSTSEPTDVKVSSVTALVSFFGKHYVVFDGIHFTGGNADGLFFNTANYGEIKNCTIDYMGLYGLRTNNAYSLIVDNNIFSHCNHIGIGLGGSGSVGDTITNNTVTYTTMFPGVHATSYSGSAIILTGTDVLCQNNAIDYSGYNGITNPAMVSTIKYNFINHCVQNLSDGGGIYSGGSRTNVLIEGNIVTNTLGNLSGYTTTYSAGGEGIYLDSNSSNVTIRNNTSSGNTTYGIYLSSGTNNNLIEYNTCYNNGRAQISINNLFQAYGATHDNIVRNNIFIAKTSTQTAARFQSANEDDIEVFISEANNNIYARPIDDNLTFFYYQPNMSVIHDYRTLADWKSFSGLDVNSTGTPYTIASENELLLVYNAESTSQPVLLTGAWKDLSGTVYYPSITLDAYSSKVLFSTSIPVPPPTTGKRATHNRRSGKNVPVYNLR